MIFLHELHPLSSAGFSYAKNGLEDQMMCYGLGFFYDTIISVSNPLVFVASKNISSAFLFWFIFDSSLYRSKLESQMN